MTTATNWKEVIGNCCSPVLESPDLGLNIAAIDAMNADPTGIPEALKALKVALGHKKDSVALLALTLLDMVVKGVLASHAYVGQPDFLKFLVRTLPEKVRDPRKKTLFKLGDGSGSLPTERADRTLVLIEAWGKAFAASRSYPHFRETYRELLAKGVRFPEPLQDELAPVFTPPPNPTAAAADTARRLSASAPTSSSSSSPAPAVAAAPSYRDAACRAAHDNAALFVDVLRTLPAAADVRTNDLLQTLLPALRASQAQGMQRLGGAAIPDTLMAELIAVNEEILQAINTYEEFSRTGRKPDIPPAHAAPVPTESKQLPAPTLAPAPAPAAAPAPAPASPTSPTAAVLDFFSMPAQQPEPASHAQPPPQPLAHRTSPRLSALPPPDRKSVV